MRVLLLMRGAPGCGKSTFIKQNNLEDYTISPDNIRMMCSSVNQNIDGTYSINQSNEKLVWETLFHLSENRMKNGDFTVIDATNSKSTEINKWKKLCEEYRYRIYCVDFTNVPIDVCKEQNKHRSPTYKVVPDNVIDNMYSRFETQNIPSGVAVIKPDELDKIWVNKIDFTNKYKKIHVIGDIHGCNTALQEYLKEGINLEDFYIFLGDYIDRGLENVDVIKFLFSIMNNNNVLLLEGNHERWLWAWANGKHARSREFEVVTKVQLEDAGISKKDVRNLYRKLGQLAYFKFYDKDYFISHGGIANFEYSKDFLTKMPTEQLIKGVGDYEDVEEISNIWSNNSQIIQIMGHRNTRKYPIKVTNNLYNLCDYIEYGGYLRAIEITKDGIEEFKTKNNVFKEVPEVTRDMDLKYSDVTSCVFSMRKNPLIMEKEFDGISSFNFTRQAFQDNSWDSQTVTARGLYIDTKHMTVMARGYNKFFNIDERYETELCQLHHTLKFPVTSYVKENGYLGIVSWDTVNDTLFVTTKSNPTGPFARWLKKRIESHLSAIGDERTQAFYTYIKENNITLLFEYVDIEDDPHIIEYDNSHLYLLDIVKNNLEFEHLSYEDLVSFANKFNFEYKKKYTVLNNWSEFYSLYKEISKEDYNLDGKYIEGFVFEDAKGFMVKFKTEYYKFWKFMRFVSHEVDKRGYLYRTSALTTPLANKYYGWIKNLYAEVEDKESIPKDIVSLRNMFIKYNEEM